MALLEQLIARIRDEDLRRDIEREVGDLKGKVSWGLVFERHLPESTRLISAPIKTGSVVWERRSATPRRFRVRSVEGSDLTVVAEPKGTTTPADAPTEAVARGEVLVEKDFADPIYPVLLSVGAVRNGPDDRPSHAVIQGENYHALEALLTAYEGQADCLYLDPPYNTGNKDWAYNNDYVDPTDAWRSSKWLSFMERRLRLGRRLLRADGVMVVTIDEHEVHHLGMLLEQVFTDARIQMVTIAITPMGVDQEGFSRVEEYAFFVFFGDAGKPLAMGDDFLSPEQNLKAAEGENVAWLQLIRSGAGATRAERPRMFYPVLVDPVAGKVVGVGSPLLHGDPDPSAPIDGFQAAWPIRTDGTLGRWRVGSDSLQAHIKKGYVRLGRFDANRGTWGVSYLGEKTQREIESGLVKIVGRDANNVVQVHHAVTQRSPVKTMWNRTRHSAGHHGSAILNSFLPDGRVFSFPKSLYVVRDTLDILTYDKPEALIVDFFAGSGTTLHATLLLNAKDEGRRRCVLVTNNEVRADVGARLHRQGLFRGDPDFEAAGVFEVATRPRVTSAITGIRSDGRPIDGAYLDGRSYSEGFEENVEFFELDYLDPGAVELGTHFSELHPLMWLAAGGIGDRAVIDQTARFAVPAGSPYAVLFDPSGMTGLQEALASRPDIKQVFIVADSDRSFASLASSLPAYTVVQLYRRYLETLRGATS